MDGSQTHVVPHAWGAAWTGDASQFAPHLAGLSNLKRNIYIAVYGRARQCVVRLGVFSGLTEEEAELGRDEKHPRPHSWDPAVPCPRRPPRPFPEMRGALFHVIVGAAWLHLVSAKASKRRKRTFKALRWPSLKLVSRLREWVGGRLRVQAATCVSFRARHAGEDRHLRHQLRPGVRHGDGRSPGLGGTTSSLINPKTWGWAPCCGFTCSPPFALGIHHRRVFPSKLER